MILVRELTHCCVTDFFRCLVRVDQISSIGYARGGPSAGLVVERLSLLRCQRPTARRPASGRVNDQVWEAKAGSSLGRIWREQFPE